VPDEGGRGTFELCDEPSASGQGLSEAAADEAWVEDGLGAFQVIGEPDRVTTVGEAWESPADELTEVGVEEGVVLG